MRFTKSCACGLLVLVVFALSLGVFKASAATAAPPAPEKIKVLLVTGFDVHQWRATTDMTRSILEETGRFDVKVCEDVGIFESSTLAPS